jgi:hypothetical protein
MSSLNIDTLHAPVDFSIGQWYVKSFSDESKPSAILRGSLKDITSVPKYKFFLES